MARPIRSGMPSLDLREVLVRRMPGHGGIAPAIVDADALGGVCCEPSAGSPEEWP